MGGSALSSGTDLSADASESCLDQQSPIPSSERLESLQDAVRSIIVGIGEDVTREGLRDTPKVGHVRESVPGFCLKRVGLYFTYVLLNFLQRVAKAWLDASWGYRQTARR